MKFSVKSGSANKQRTACIVVAVFEEGPLSGSALKLDQASQGYLSNVLKQGDIAGKVGQTCLLQQVPGLGAERVLLVGCGKEQELNERHYKKVIATAIKALQAIRIVDAIFLLQNLSVNQRSRYWTTRLAIEVITAAHYRFEQFKSKKDEQGALLQKITLLLEERSELEMAEKAVTHGTAIAFGVKAAKDLGNLPPNICNAAYMASLARQLADNHQTVTTTVIGEQQMKELGMNAYLAVGQGSHNESMMSIIEYRGSTQADAPPIVLVGKGLTFDSGGISIKPADSMDEMKYDMCGAASVYGVMCAATCLQLPLNIIGVLAGCENMPGGHAYRPGDILTTLSGQTVEVLNTDAEGRLVLCDVLSYVQRFQPALVIDIATLTGACVVALGNHISGLMSTDDTLAEKLLAAAQYTGDHAWRLPIIDEMQEAIDSNFADMANVGSRWGGAITAACFLSRFTQDYRWAHLDIAGTAWMSGKEKGATGRPVPLLMQFLLQQAKLDVEQ